MRLVHFVLNKYYPGYTKDEDIIQCGMVGLVGAANTFDESKGTFSTYAVRCVMNQINTELRNRKKYKTDLSLDNEVLFDDGDTGTFMDLLVGDEDVEYFDVKGFIDSLDETEIKVMKLSIAGKTGAEIGEVLGISQPTAWRLKRRVEMKWRRYNG